jgi:hypothetical protein
MDTALNGVSCDLQRRRSRAKRAENLSECDMEVAQAGLRILLSASVFLRLDRCVALQMPHMVRKRAVLRHQKQRGEHNIQKTALQNHFRYFGMMASTRLNRYSLPHNVCGMQSMSYTQTARPAAPP